jgi:[calcium/calmodulin-dependent protein kinase] kinase
MNKAKLQMKSFGKGKNAYDCVIEELKVLKGLEHPNVIWLHEIIDANNKDYIYLVTEFHERGSLGDQVEKLNLKFKDHNKKYKDKKELQRFVGLNEKKVRLYFIDMLKALNYCHKTVNVIHRDIKPDNIMINYNNEAVLIDFGVSAIVEGVNDELDENRGSQLFYAPEMFNKSSKKHYTVRGTMTDLWALGVTLYFLLAGRFPAHDATNPLELKDIVCNQDVDYSYIKSEGAKNLLQKMMIKDPEKRATLDDILDDQWVTECNETIDLDQAEIAEQDNTGKKGFGNLKRLLKSKALGQGATSKNLLGN